MKKYKYAFAILIILLFVGAIFYFNQKHIDTDKTKVTTTTISYNTDLNTKYISSAETWPPEVVFQKGDYKCVPGGNEINQNGETLQKTISGRNYCITVESEGAAGSIYTTYSYMTKFGEQLAETKFILRFVQCDNYEDPNKTECKNERANFNPDNLTDQIFQKAFSLR